MNNNIWTNHTVFPYTWHTLRGIVTNIGRIPYGIRWSLQRIFKGYASCDVWSFDEYLARVLVQGMRDLAKNGYGYPDQFGSTENWQKALLENAQKIEEGMEDDWECGDNFKIWSERKNHTLNEGLTWVMVNFRSLWD